MELQQTVTDLMLEEFGHSWQTGWKSTILVWPFIYLVMYPLWMLWIQGPGTDKWGFWQGRQLSQICNIMEGGKHKNTEYYEKNHNECLRIVYDQFYSFYVLVRTILYIYLLYQTVWLILSYFRQAVETLPMLAASLTHKRLVTPSGQKLYPVAILDPRSRKSIMLIPGWSPQQCQNLVSFDLRRSIQ